MLDVADINHPVVMDSFAGVDARNFDVQGDLVFVAGGNSGIWIFRVSVQGKFEAISTIVPPFPLDSFFESMSVVARNGYIYVAVAVIYYTEP